MGFFGPDPTQDERIETARQEIERILVDEMGRKPSDTAMRRLVALVSVTWHDGGCDASRAAYRMGPFPIPDWARPGPCFGCKTHLFEPELTYCGARYCERCYPFAPHNMPCEPHVWALGMSSLNTVTGDTRTEERCEKCGRTRIRQGRIQI